MSTGAERDEQGAGKICPLSMLCIARQSVISRVVPRAYFRNAASSTQVLEHLRFHGASVTLTTCMPQYAIKHKKSGLSML
jgi:hypothetical protein